MLPQDEAADAARPWFSGKLGLPANPHEQYIERCIDAWLEGPPPEWEQEWTQYQQALAQYTAEMQAYHQGVIVPQQEQALRQQAELQQHGPMVAATHQAGIANEAEKVKHANVTAQAEQAHGHAMAEKQAEAEIAKAAVPPAPAPPPEIVVPPPDMTPIAHALEEVGHALQLLAAREPPVIPPPDFSTLQPPIVNVHPATAPNVTVEAPAPVQPKRGKRKGKLKPDGNGGFSFEADDAGGNS